MSARVPSRGSDQFNLRFPDGMRDRIAELAQEAGRSMNAEIIARLQASIEQSSAENPFVRIARQLEEESVRRAADEIEAVVQDMDSVLGPIDSDAWRAGAYSYSEEPIGARSINPYGPDTPQHASWVAGRAFAVAAELKKAVRQAQGLPDEGDGEG